MVAIKTALGMAGAVGAYVATKRAPALHKDPRVDAGIKGAIGLAAVIGASMVPQEQASIRTVLVAGGVGVTMASAGEFVPFL